MTDNNTNLVPYTPPRKSSPPVCTMRDGGIVVKIWENASKGGIFINATVERVYTDKQTGETRTAKSFSLRDIKTLQKLFTRAKSEMEKRALNNLK